MGFIAEEYFYVQESESFNPSFRAMIVTPRPKPSLIAITHCEMILSRKRKEISQKNGINYSKQVIKFVCHI